MRFMIPVLALAAALFSSISLAQDPGHRPLAEQEAAAGERPLGEEGEAEPRFAVSFMEAALIAGGVGAVVAILVLVGMRGRNREVEQRSAPEKRRRQL